MSWWIDTVVSMSESEELSYIQRKADIVADDFASLPAYNSQQSSTTDPFILVRGSKAFVLATSKKYILNSQNQWVEIHDESGGGASSADQVSYDNTDSGMTATNVQDAIDETHALDDMQDRALAELYAADVNIRLRIDGLEDDIDAKTTVAEIYGLPPTTIAPEEGTTESLNNYTTPGVYTVPTATAAGRVTESPVTNKGYRLEVKQYRSGTYYRQTIMPWSEANAIYTRSRQGGTTWTSWYKFEATQVQTVQSLNSPLNLSRNDLNESLDSNFDLIDSIPEEEEGE